MNIYLTAEQMKEVDDIAVNKYGITLESMMEKAGKTLADFVSSLNPENVIIAYGSGYNGGGGLVAARYLFEKFPVFLLPASRNLKETTKLQLQKTSITEIKSKELDNFKNKQKTIIVDTLLGYSINRNPEGAYSEIINKINEEHGKGVIVVSLDLPSGLNPNNGEVYDPHVVADYTLTLAYPKIGLKNNSDVTGEIKLIDIGIPDKVLDDLKLKEINNN